MNIGKDNKHPKYICDKCKSEIKYIDKRGFVGLHRYCKNTHRDINYKKDFDLCTSCEKKFREWLDTREIPTFKEMIGNFPKYEKKVED